MLELDAVAPGRAAVVEPKKVRAVQEVSSRAVRRRRLDALLRLIMGKESRELMGADRATLYLVIPRNGRSVSKVMQGGAVFEIRARRRCKRRVRLVAHLREISTSHATPAVPALVRSQERVSHAIV